MLEHERRLARRLSEALAGDTRFRLLGPAEPSRRTGLVALTVEGLAPEEVGAVLDEVFNVAVRPGLHCAPSIHRELGTFPDGAVRIAPGPFNTEEEIDVVANALRQMV